MNRANYHNWSYGTAPVAVSVSSASFSGLTSNSLDTEVGTTFSYIDNLTVVRGRHTLKFGANVMRVRLNNSGNTLTTQSLSYASTDDFINNKAASATYLQGEGVVGNRRTFYQGYAQDEFKVTPNLTLNLGLRYEFYSVAHEILNRSAVVDIQGCGGFCPKGTPYYAPNTKDFGPRVGLAWAPAFAPRQNHHPHRLRHLLRRQPERRFQRPRGKRRAALFPLIHRFPRTRLPADRIPRSGEPALQPQGNRPPPQGSLVQQLGFRGPAGTGQGFRRPGRLTSAARVITCSISTRST